MAFLLTFVFSPGIFTPKGKIIIIIIIIIIIPDDTGLYLPLISL